MRYRKFEYPKDLIIGNKIYTKFGSYIIKSITNDKVEFLRVKEGNLFFSVKSIVKRMAGNGHMYVEYPIVKDTRLARKLYPDHEVLENGMLRIKNEV